VIGTTGHTSESETDLKAASQHIPILFSPNFSLGVAVTLEAAKLIGHQLQGLCQVEIVEVHPQTKKDRPSGTAIALAKAAGSPEAPIHSIRAGDIVGEHTVYFILGGERIELKHHAQSREAFARGALLAAKFLKSKPPGLYNIKDMLNEPR
jgi:4-hydroxy-tetrahydrodipicolinate reductase